MRVSRPRANRNARANTRLDNANNGAPDSPPGSLARGDRSPAGRVIVVLPTIRPWTQDAAHVSTTAAIPSGEVEPYRFALPTTNHVFLPSFPFWHAFALMGAYSIGALVIGGVLMVRRDP